MQISGFLVLLVALTAPCSPWAGSLVSPSEGYKKQPPWCVEICYGNCLILEPGESSTLPSSFYSSLIITSCIGYHLFSPEDLSFLFLAKDWIRPFFPTLSKSLILQKSSAELRGTICKVSGRKTARIGP